MNLDLSAEQQQLKDAAVAALSRDDTVGAARRSLDGGPGIDQWSTVATAGWSGMLVAEEHGGTGLEIYDALLVLEECGRRLAGAGLLGHLCATVVLGRAAAAGDVTAASLLVGLAAGERRAALLFARPPIGAGDWSVDGGHALPVLAADGLWGAVDFQPGLLEADMLVVPAVVDGRVAAVTVDVAAGGVQRQPVPLFDASRPLANVRFDGAQCTVLSATAAALAEGWHAGQALLAAEALGTTLAVLDLAVAYAKDRHAFGRPIGSYQAIKHQLVEMFAHAERVRNLCMYTGLAHRDPGLGELPLAANAARVAGDEAADYATRTCIAVHGGIGATWEHDAPLFWRRAQVTRLLLGGTVSAQQVVALETLSRTRSRRATHDMATASA